jgi:hypothetical protein
MTAVGRPCCIRTRIMLRQHVVEIVRDAAGERADGL